MTLASEPVREKVRPRILETEETGRLELSPAPPAAGGSVPQ